MVIAALIKPLALALAPLVLVAAVRAGKVQLRQAVAGMALSAVLAVAAFAPFWSGLDTLQGMARAELFTDSPGAALVRGLELAGVRR